MVQLSKKSLFSICKMLLVPEFARWENEPTVQGCLKYVCTKFRHKKWIYYLWFLATSPGRISHYLQFAFSKRKRSWFLSKMKPEAEIQLYLIFRRKRFTKRARYCSVEAFAVFLEPKDRPRKKHRKFSKKAKISPFSRAAHESCRDPLMILTRMKWR